MAPGAEAAARWEAGERAARAAAEERGRRAAEESVREEAARREAAAAARRKAEETARREAEEEAAKAAAPRTPPPWRPAAEAFDGRSPYVGILASEVKEVEELRAMLAVPRSSSRISPAASPATCRSSAPTHNPPHSAATLSTALSPGACRSAAGAAADRSVRAADGLPTGLPWRVGEGVHY